MDGSGSALSSSATLVISLALPVPPSFEGREISHHSVGAINYLAVKFDHKI